MKPIRWSLHALKNLAEREIPRDKAEECLRQPELTVSSGPHRTVLMRRYRDQRLGQEMLIRAIIEDRAEETVVITVYITSKIGKYMKEA